MSNVVSLRARQPAPEPLAFAIGARVDLRVGALAAGVVRPKADDAFGFSSLARLLRAARMTWKERGAYTGLTLAVPAHLHAGLEAELLSEAAIEAGCVRTALSFELSERQIVNAGADLAEELRARGWNIALRGDPDCPLPFSTRARSLYSELVLDAPPTPDPFLAMDHSDRSPLARRLVAAKSAGLIVTAESVQSAAQAKTLAMIGFNRGGAPYAEACLR
ncbi:MAG: hypothetical protein QM759_01805 [Terricaulis sp.]